jgi:hypothetical protein
MSLRFSRPLSPLILAAALLVSLARSDDADAQQAPTSQVTRDTNDPRWIWGTVTVNGTPEHVWSRVERVEAWPLILTDIAQMKVVEHHDTRWKIDLETKTFGHGPIGFDVVTSPDRVATLKADKVGVHVLANTRVKPGPVSGQSVVTYSVFIEVNGPASLLISEKTLREKQAHMAQVALNDIARAFGTP